MLKDKIDKDLLEILKKELKRQQNTISLIASENLVSEAVLKIAQSTLTNKYAEGYPDYRYYEGCQYADEVENLAIEKLKTLFEAEYVNVQPHSGSQANAAAYLAFLKPNDKVLALGLSDGGHLSHGFNINFSGITYHFTHYHVDPSTYRLNYEEIRKLALQIKPKLILTGYSAYPRVIDFAKFREICDEVGAYLMVDMAHIAGLIAAKVHPSPVPYADVITSTTHKTLKGPRSGIILAKKEHAKKLNSAVFPGIQGGPLVHIIAAKAQAFIEALSSDFVDYQKQVLANCQTFCDQFLKKGYHLLTGGSDNHLLLIDALKSVNLTGKEAANRLNRVGIIVNKNFLPYDTLKATVTSGVRIGTPWITSRGFKEKEVTLLVDWIDQIWRSNDWEKLIPTFSLKVKNLLNDFPIYKDLEF
ncbi:serine hydroxymethyltransferase [Mycoplasma sp. SG1]|uniref:serine hydroxymethyltransferase n=1 Tax=Mycoplasma sp. SG1 TaxID=2810348 RepID=UPI00202554B1|nr:serine hydroxymethyltransferase [Mycoplasma sp. SG1]URM52966.1 serine hydroxymethyltransferase [Mycoplasma sp. SG1]